MTPSSTAPTADPCRSRIPSPMPMSARIGLAGSRRARSQGLGGEELGHERRGRPLEQVGERALLDDASRVHERDGGAEESGLTDVVSHQDDGLAQRREEPAELTLQLGPNDG